MTFQVEQRKLLEILEELMLLHLFDTHPLRWISLQQIVHKLLTISRQLLIHSHMPFKNSLQQPINIILDILIRSVSHQQLECHNANRPQIDGTVNGRTSSLLAQSFGSHVLGGPADGGVYLTDWGH